MSEVPLRYGLVNAPRKHPRGYVAWRVFVLVLAIVATVASLAVSIAHGQVVRVSYAHAEGSGTASGAIVRSEGGKNLVLTCGHFFRGMKPGAEIEVEVFDDSGSYTGFIGKAVYVDLKSDVGLLEFSSKTVYPAYNVSSRAVKVGDKVSSLGCNHGKRPTTKRHVITSVNRYQGASNFEYSGKPEGDRSGGPVLNDSGEIVGVTFAADMEFDRGLAVAAGPVHDALKKTLVETCRDIELVVFSTLWCPPCVLFDKELAGNAANMRSRLSAICQIRAVKWKGSPDAGVWLRPDLVREFTRATGKQLTSVPTFWVRGDKEFLTEFDGRNENRGTILVDYVKAARERLGTKRYKRKPQEVAPKPPAEPPPKIDPEPPVVVEAPPAPSEESVPFGDAVEEPKKPSKALGAAKAIGKAAVGVATSPVAAEVAKDVGLLAGWTGVAIGTGGGSVAATAILMGLRLLKKRRERRSAVAKKFPDMPQRNMDEARQLAKLRELEGRNPLLDAVIGAKAETMLRDEIELEGVNKSYAADLLRRLREYAEDVAPVSVKSKPGEV